VAEAFGEVEEGEGDGDGDIEALGETVHGDFDVFVSEVDGLGGEPREFGAEDECHRSGDVEVSDKGIVGVGGSGDDAVAATTQLGIGRLDVGVGVVVDPFGGAYGDIAGGVEGVVALDDVDILYAETVAGAEDGGGIVRLVDILQCNGDMAGAQGCYAVDELASIFRDKLRGTFIEGLFLFMAETRET